MLRVELPQEHTLEATAVPEALEVATRGQATSEVVRVTTLMTEAKAASV